MSLIICIGTNMGNKPSFPATNEYIGKAVVLIRIRQIFCTFYKCFSIYHSNIIGHETYSVNTAGVCCAFGFTL